MTPTPSPTPAPTPIPTPGPQASAISLPKTGQTTCYDPSGVDAVISCTGTGQDGELQIGMAEPNPHFTSDNTGDCVTDNMTGLMWTRNGNLASGTVAAGTLTWQEALDFANNLELCGFSDWRLPNRNELLSLINYELADNTLALNGSGFSNVSRSYWSSTTAISFSYNGDQSGAWVIGMAGGLVTSNLKTQNFHNVWPVRAGYTAQVASISLPATGQTTCSDSSGVLIDCANTGQDGDSRAGVAWPNPRFTVGTGDMADCVTDNLTGLVWVRAPDNLGTASLATALSTTNNLTLCGFSDWRLPNIREMGSMANAGSDDVPAYLTSQGFSGVPLSYSWTSTSDAFAAQQNTRDEWIMLLKGLMHTSGKANSYAFWPVRGGQ